MTEDKIKQIDGKLREIEEEIARLSSLRRKLISQKEKLTDKKNFEKSEFEAAKNDWESESFQWSQDVRLKLKNSFKLNDFRSQQLPTINATLSKKDVILVSPTGGGKSLTFQLPALCDKGITLVISPLVSLMEDQLYSLEKKNIPAEMLSSNSTKEQVKHVHSILEDPSFSTGKQLKLLYVTPERLAKSKRLMQSLQKCYQSKKLDRIAIDEVHCCSTFGHDFRPDYKFLGTMKTLFPDVPIIGVTATASKKVIIDVQKMLNIRGCIIFQSPFNRPNLYYHVMEKPVETEACVDVLADLLLNRFRGKSGIIYTFSIKDTETLTSQLLQRDCKVRPYHAQLDHQQRSKIYLGWMKGEVQAVIATVAFGMGVDKSNVRFVIHHTISKSMENFYQESGRCGRDGKFAESILLYRLADMFRISSLTFTEINGLKNAYSMINYAISSKTCRRDQFSKYFTEVWNEENCGKMCDCCYYKNASRMINPPKLNILEHYKTILEIIDRASLTDTRLTALKLIDAWYGKGPKAQRIESSPPDIDRSFAEQIIAYLIINDFLREDFHYTAYSTNSYIIKGPKTPQDDEIEFQPARIYDLPDCNELSKFYESTPKLPAIKRSPESSSSSSYDIKQSAKKRKVSNDSIILSSSSLEKLIDQKIRKVLSSSVIKSSSQSESDTSEDDDVVLVVPKKEDEIIDLD